jgi:hypothetical protein
VRDRRARVPKGGARRHPVPFERPLLDFELRLLKVPRGSGARNDDR